MNGSTSNSKTSELRRRGKGKQSRNAKTKASDSDKNGPGPSTPSSDPESSGSSSSLDEFKPIALLTAVFLVPYGLYIGYLYVLLQRPEWPLSLAASGWLPSRIAAGIRPAVGVGDPRRVLVVGTMSSGTTQLAHDLASTLGLEIGHENSETNWSFVRDGTVSWFHGIRFLPRPGIDDETRLVFELPAPKDPAPKDGSESESESEASSSSASSLKPNPHKITLEGDLLFQYVVNSLCHELHPNMGFHPFMFRDNGKCSLRQSWDACWKDECKNFLQQEWGCALQQESSSSSLSSSSSSSSSSCTTPYHKHLLQVRHPLRTVESLVTKFCIGGVEGDVQPSFVTFANALFPQHEFSKLSCIETAGYYVYEYNTAMLRAANAGRIDEVYSVEGATPCAVAKRAGFMEERDGEEVHERRIREHLSTICRDESESESENENESESESETGNEPTKGEVGDKANRRMISTKNTYNQGLLSLDWDDLLGGRHRSQREEGDRDLQQRLKALAEQELDYN